MIIACRTGIWIIQFLRIRKLKWSSIDQVEIYEFDNGIYDERRMRLYFGKEVLEISEFKKRAWRIAEREMRKRGLL